MIKGGVMKKEGNNWEELKGQNLHFRTKSGALIEGCLVDFQNTLLKLVKGNIRGTGYSPVDPEWILLHPDAIEMCFHANPELYFTRGY
jgi:hypothetical protein